jgi:hypothetical protein
MNTSIRGFGGVGVGKKLGGGGKEGKAKDVMERELEADVAGRRHMESLALRMDFAGCKSLLPVPLLYVWECCRKGTDRDHKLTG